MKTISEEYREANRQLHETMPHYGVTGHRYAELVADMARSIGVQELLDYGCGKCTLAQALPQLSVRNYDPAIEGLDAEPKPHDLVVCTDVLEHIEPKYLDNVLRDLRRLTQKVLFIQVATRPAEKILPDGRNAHLIIENSCWWIARILRFFTMDSFTNLDDMGFIAVLTPKRLPQ